MKKLLCALFALLTLAGPSPGQAPRQPVRQTCWGGARQALQRQNAELVRQLGDTNTKLIDAQQRTNEMLLQRQLQPQLQAPAPQDRVVPIVYLVPGGPSCPCPHATPQQQAPAAPQAPPSVQQPAPSPLPQTPPQFVLPQTPPQFVLPQTPPQYVLPQTPPQLVLPQGQPQLVLPQGGAQIGLPQTQPQQVVPLPQTAPQQVNPLPQGSPQLTPPAQPLPQTAPQSPRPTGLQRYQGTRVANAIYRR